MALVKCEACYGSGTHFYGLRLGTSRTCPVCKGTTKVEVDVAPVPMITGNPPPLCRTCLGMGKTSKVLGKSHKFIYIKCPVCFPKVKKIKAKPCK